LSDIIYKYTESPRFLENGLFRFSQPVALNDPDEARVDLSFGKYVPDDYRLARLKAVKAGISSISDADLETLFMHPFPAGRFDEKRFPGLWPAKEPRLGNRSFRTIDEYDEAVARRAVELARLFADATYGVFCLSSSDGEHMWAYYADNHRGLRITFDAHHRFFTEGARPIQYSDEPVYISCNSGWVRIGGERLSTQDILNSNIGFVPDELLFRKRLAWQQEAEIRMVKKLDMAIASAGLDSSGHQVFLFDIPMEALKAITIGYKANEKFVSEVTQSIRANNAWSHLSIFQRRWTADGVVENRIS
jgi:hypothetical protein